MSNKKLWFKSKLYGWGWTPCSKQGWAVTAIFIVLTIVPAFCFEKLSISIVWFYAYIAALLLILICICIKKGEKPRWNWG